MAIYIQTKYLAPTNTKGARIQATCVLSGKKTTVPLDHGQERFERHKEAAQKLLESGDYKLYAVNIFNYVEFKEGYLFFNKCQSTSFTD